MGGGGFKIIREHNVSSETSFKVEVCMHPSHWSETAPPPLFWCSIEKWWHVRGLLQCCNSGFLLSWWKCGLQKHMIISVCLIWVYSEEVQVLLGSIAPKIVDWSWFSYINTSSKFKREILHLISDLIFQTNSQRHFLFFQTHRTSRGPFSDIANIFFLKCHLCADFPYATPQS